MSILKTLMILIIMLQRKSIKKKLNKFSRKPQKIKQKQKKSENNLGKKI